MNDEIKLALRGYLILGGGAIVWIVAAVMCARIAAYGKIDYKGAWPNALHDMPKDDARSSLVSREE